MIRLAVLLITALMISGVDAAAAEAGRYQITPGDPMVLLDTSTGKTWRLVDGKWLPIQVVQPKTTPPKPKETTQQRWQRESDARRLNLKRSGPQPAPKSPARSLLEKLAPSQ